VLGIVTALRSERRWIRTSDVEPVIELSGMGASRADGAARRLVDRGVTALVSWGTAGGLDPTLRPGTVVLPDLVVLSDGGECAADLEWRDRLQSRIGDRVPTTTTPLFHAGHVVESPQHKREIWQRCRAAAADMESGAIARVAEEYGLPWIAVRVVLDAADDRLPGVVLSAADTRRLGSAAVLCWRIARRPGQWPTLFTLWRAYLIAGRSMRRLWSLAGPDLALKNAVGRNP